MGTILEYLAPIGGDIPFICRESNPGLVTPLISRDSNLGPNKRQGWMLPSDQYSYMFATTVLAIASLARELHTGTYIPTFVPLIPLPPPCHHSCGYGQCNRHRLTMCGAIWWCCIASKSSSHARPANLSTATFAASCVVHFCLSSCHRSICPRCHSRL